MDRFLWKLAKLQDDNDIDGLRMACLGVRIDESILSILNMDNILKIFDDTTIESADFSYHMLLAVAIDYPAIEEHKIKCINWNARGLDNNTILHWIAKEGSSGPDASVIKTLLSRLKKQKC